MTGIPAINSMKSVYELIDIEAKTIGGLAPSAGWNLKMHGRGHAATLINQAEKPSCRDAAKLQTVSNRRSCGAFLCWFWFDRDCPPMLK